MGMEKIAKQFQNDHLGKGTVTKITDYSFTWTTIPKKKEEQPKSCVYMYSWFC